MKIRALIVDDEPHARQRVCMLARKERDLHIIAECSGGAEAVATIHREHPDLVFLDVQMPGMDGFELLRKLPRTSLPLVIFITAHEKHALRAFDQHALDYLLKPYKPARFQQAVQRVREALASRQSDSTRANLVAALSSLPSAAPALTRLTIRNDEKVIVLRTADIDYIESAGNYVAVHVGRESHIMRETLQSLETQLGYGRFLRISRSALVNLERVKELRPMFKGEHIVVLQNDRQLPMTRGLREVETALKFS